jgi:hypothetical protein
MHVQRANYFDVISISGADRALNVLVTSAPFFVRRARFFFLAASIHVAQRPAAGTRATRRAPVCLHERLTVASRAASGHCMRTRNGGGEVREIGDLRGHCLRFEPSIDHRPRMSWSLAKA